MTGNQGLLSRMGAGITRAIVGVKPESLPVHPNQDKEVQKAKQKEKKKRVKRARSVKKRHTVPEFNTSVILDESTRQTLSKVFINHRQCNSFIRTMVKENPDMSVQKVKEHLYRFIEENKITEYIASTLDAEVVYIRKKILEGKNPRSGNTSYISLTGNSASNDAFTFNAKRNMFMIESLGLMMKLETPAKLPTEGRMFFISIGTTNTETLEDLDFNIYVNRK